MLKDDNNWCAVVGLLCIFLGSEMAFGLRGIGIALIIFGAMAFAGAAHDRVIKK